VGAPPPRALKILSLLFRKEKRERVVRKGTKQAKSNEKE
jgi:hypothetical protein